MVASGLSMNTVGQSLPNTVTAVTDRLGFALMYQNHSDEMML